MKGYNYCVSLIVTVVAMLGMLSPSSRGALMTTACFLFMFMGQESTSSLILIKKIRRISGIQMYLIFRQSISLCSLCFFALMFFLQCIWWLLCWQTISHTEGSSVEERSFLCKSVIPKVNTIIYYYFSDYVCLFFQHLNLLCVFGVTKAFDELKCFDISFVCIVDSNFVSCSGFWNLLHPQLFHLGRTFLWGSEYYYPDACDLR